MLPRARLVSEITNVRLKREYIQLGTLSVIARFVFGSDNCLVERYFSKNVADTICSKV